MEQHGLGRVQVLRFAVTERATAEPDRPPAGISDREHDAVPKTVVVLTVVLGNNQPGREEPLNGLRRLAELVEDVTPAIRRVADTETTSCRTVNAAALEVFDGRRRFLEAALPVTRNRIQQREQLVVSTRRFVALVTRHLDTHGVRKALDRLDEVHVVVFHEEADRRPVRATAEAVIKALGGTDRERGGFLVVEWATGLVFPAGLFELYATADDFNNIRPRNQVVDEVLRDKSGHTDANVARLRPGSEATYDL